MNFAILSATQFLLFMAPLVMGSGKFSIDFIDYDNPGDKKFNGECCDGESSVGNDCSGKCDYSINLCLGISLQDPCSIGQLEIGSVGIGEDSSTFTFDQFFPSGQPNPIPLSVNSWPGVAYLTVNISDVDPGKDELVDMFQRQVLFPVPIHGRLPSTNEYRSFSITGQRLSAASRLQITVAVFCDTHYYNNDCSVNCVPSDDCQGHYNCDPSTGHRVCDEGWQGISCNEPEESHSCGEVPMTCMNGATCVRYGNRSMEYYCCCRDGFDGQYCTNDVDECYSSPCMHGGQCIDGIGSYQCLCRERYTGKNCEREIKCDDNPCFNGGTCVNFGFTGFMCVCGPDYSGFTCSELVTTTTPMLTTAEKINTTSVETSLKTTSSDNSTPPAVCPPYYYGNNCAVYCRPQNDCSGHYICDIISGMKNCLAGWGGNNCDEAQSPLDSSCQPACKQGGVCFNKTCCCPEGTRGIDCRLSPPFCTNTTCLNDGVCEDTTSGYQCTCKRGFTGYNCETHILFTLPNSDDSVTMTTILPVTCPDGLHLPISNSHNNILCPGNKCRNGGECINGSCCCNEGFTGKLCHVEILECESQPCLHGGKCLDNIGKYDCICPPEYTGKDCETLTTSSGSTTPTVRPCDNVTCFNGGTCVNDPINRYICLCSEGFGGGHCETKINRNSTDTTPQCPEYFYGPFCSVYCKPDDTCEGGHYYCGARSGTKVCRSGWFGRNCDIRFLIQAVDPECPEVKCKSDGQCFKGKCCCSEGYTGKYCEEEIVACLSNPCYNGGTCVDKVDGYECICMNDTSGSDCEFPTSANQSTTPGIVTLPCSLSPCKNFGICIPIGRDDFRCVCNTGYTGIVCDEIISLVSTLRPGQTSTSASLNGTTWVAGSTTDIAHSSVTINIVSTSDNVNTPKPNFTDPSSSSTPRNDVSFTTIADGLTTPVSSPRTIVNLSTLISSPEQPTTTMLPVTTTESIPTETIYITGNMNITAAKENLEKIINQAVQNLTNGQSCEPVTEVDDRTSIFINTDGYPVIRVTYHVVFENCSENSQTVIHPLQIEYLVDKLLTVQEPFKSNGNTVYSLPHSTLVDPRLLLSVFFVGFVSDRDVELLPAMLKEIWKTFKPEPIHHSPKLQPELSCDTCDLTTFIMVPDMYIGDFGMQLTRLRYAAYLNGDSLTRKSMDQPSVAVYNDALVAAGVSSMESIYEGDVAVPYSSFHTVDLDSVTAPVGVAGKQLKDQLMAAWKQYAVENLGLCVSSAACEVKMDFAKAEKYFDSTNKKQISRISYMVTVIDKPVDAKYISGPSSYILRDHGVPFCECLAFPEYFLSVVGKTKLEDDTTLQFILIQAAGSPVAVQSKQDFLTRYGQNITQVWTDIRPEQNTAAFRRNVDLKLFQSEFQMPNISYSAVYSVYVTDAEENIVLDNLSNGLVDAWYWMNDHIPKSKLGIQEVKLESGYIDKERKTSVTRIYYTVKIENADSKYVNIGEPASSVLRKWLSGKDVTECDCVALMEHGIFLKGITDVEQNRTEIQTAITNAWKKENPDFNGHLNVTVQKTETGYHGMNGEKLLKVLYTVEPVDSNLKDNDLKNPKDNIIQNSFNHTMPGIVIYTGNVEKDEEPEEEWWPILLAVLLVLLVIIVAIVIGMFLYRRYRNRQSRTLRQKPEEIVGYDKEHFSSKPDFSKPDYENPVFCYEEAEDHQKSSTYYVNGTSE